MKRKKNLLILLAVFLVMLCGYFAISALTSDEDTTEDTTESISVVELSTDEIEEITWEWSDETVTLSYEDGEWSYEDDAFALDTDYPETMASELEAVTASRVLEDVEDMSEYGLDEPQITITVSLADGSEVTLEIGDQNSLTEEYYLIIDGGTDVYLVESSLAESFMYGLYDILELETVLDVSDADTVYVNSDSSTSEIVYLADSSDYSYSTSLNWFIVSDGEYLLVDDSKCDDILATVTDLEWLECVAYNASDDELEEYGLDDESASSITLKGTKTVTVETNETDDDGNVVTEEEEIDYSLTLLIGNECDSGVYVRFEDSTMVYVISADDAEVLLTVDYADLRADTVCTIELDDVSGIAVSSDDLSYTIEFTTEETEDDDGETVTEDVYYADDEEVDEDDVEDLLSAVSALSVSQILPDDTVLSDVLMSLTFTLTSGNTDEITVTVYSYGTGYAVEFNGEMLLTDSDSVENLVSYAESMV